MDELRTRATGYIQMQETFEFRDRRLTLVTRHENKANTFPGGNERRGEIDPSVCSHTSTRIDALARRHPETQRRQTMDISAHQEESRSRRSHPDQNSSFPDWLTIQPNNLKEQSTQLN
ncbi:hypothetical protein CR513_29985, partial [Mucuna pruriens]